MKKKVRIGILGCADVAKRHSIKAFQSLDNAKVVSISSRDYSKARKWASDFGIAAEASYDALLKNKNIDAVYIPLPISLHKKWVLKAARAGKHIICEKSLAESIKSAKEMVKACRSKGLVLYENFMCDFHPQHEKVLSLIKRGGIGQPFVFRSFYGFPPFDKDNIRYNKKLGASALYDAGCYIVFMARKIFGKEPVSVVCNLSIDKKTGVDIKGSMMLEFPGGQTALGAFSYDSAYQNNYSLWGGKAIINVERAYSISPETKPVIKLSRFENYKDIVHGIEAPVADQFKLIFRDFCDTILHKRGRGKKIDRIYSQLIAQAKVLEALCLASKGNRKVRLEEIK